MFSEYLANGSVNRAEIVAQIKNRKISRDKIEKLCEDPRIKAAFKGTDFPDKRPKRDWNKDYLQRLSFVPVAGAFNRDYLLYLDEVAEYVSKVKFQKIIIAAGAVIVLVIIAGVVVYQYIYRKPATLPSGRTTPTGETSGEVISEMPVSGGEGIELKPMAPKNDVKRSVI